MYVPSRDDGTQLDLDDLPQQAEVLRRAMHHFDRDERVESLVLSGSLAAGTADCWSDVDLYLIPKDEAFADVFAERAATAATFGRLVAQFTVEGVGGGSSDQIVLYEGPVKLDLMYYRRREVEPHRKWVDALVVKDVARLMHDVQARSRALAPASLLDEQLLRLDQQFWIWCWYALGKISRGEGWAALDALHEMRSAAVLPLLHASTGHADEGYRRLETKFIDSHELAGTVATLDPDSQWLALREEIALFVSVRNGLFNSRRLPLNRSAEDAIRSAVGK